MESDLYSILKQNGLDIQDQPWAQRGKTLSSLAYTLGVVNDVGQYFGTSQQNTELLNRLAAVKTSGGDLSKLSSLPSYNIDFNGASYDLTTGAGSNGFAFSNWQKPAYDPSTAAGIFGVSKDIFSGNAPAVNYSSVFATEAAQKSDPFFADAGKNLPEPTQPNIVVPNGSYLSPQNQFPTAKNNAQNTPMSSTTSTPISAADYQLRPGESIAAYNARIAAARGESAPAPATITSTSKATMAPKISAQDYYLKPGESLDQYNTRIASLRGETPPPAIGTQGTTPSPGTPIDASGLGGGYSSTDLSKILGAGAGGGTTSSDIAGLLSLYGASTAADQNYQTIADQLTKAMSKIGGEGADLQTELNKQGVPQAYDQAKSLNLQAAQLKGELDTFDAETQAGLSKLEGDTIPTPIIQGQQAEYQKQRDLTRLSKAAELSSTIALAQAYQGNADLGTTLAQKAVDMKYQPILASIDSLKTQLSIAQDKMTKEDANRSKVIDTLLTLKLKEIDTAKQNEKDIQTVAIQAAANGAPLSVVNAMKAAPDAATAAHIGSAYIKGNLESISGGTSGLSKDNIQTGATKAGMSIDQFSNLPVDVQNYFANSSDTKITQDNIMGLVDKLSSGQLTADQYTKKINNLVGLSSPVRNYFIGLLSSQAQRQPSQGTASFMVQGAKNVISSAADFFSGLFN